MDPRCKGDDATRDAGPGGVMDNHGTQQPGGQLCTTAKAAGKANQVERNGDMFRSFVSFQGVV